MAPYPSKCCKANRPDLASLTLRVHVITQPTVIARPQAEAITTSAINPLTSSLFLGHELD
jgi:hypothetical protein